MRLTERQTIFLLLAPAVLVLGVLFVGGLLTGFARSFNYLPLIGLDEPNLDAYRNLFATRGFGQSLLLSFHIAFFSSVISAVIATGAAMLLRRTFAGKRIFLLLFQFNITIPHIVGAIGIMYLFSQSGVFARLAHELGMIAQPGDFPALIFDPAAIGIIMQYVWKEIPFIGIVVLAALQVAGDEHEEIARTLGASRWQTFRHVVLPLILPAVLAAAVIVFAYTFGAFEIPALLGQHHPAALPVLAYQLYTDPDLAARPQAMALAMVIAALSVLSIICYVGMVRRYVHNK